MHKQRADRRKSRKFFKSVQAEHLLQLSGERRPNSLSGSRPYLSGRFFRPEAYHTSVLPRMDEIKNIVCSLLIFSGKPLGTSLPAHVEKPRCASERKAPKGRAPNPLCLPHWNPVTTQKNRFKYGDNFDFHQHGIHSGGTGGCCLS
jgi:hypothetical protein